MRPYTANRKDLVGWLENNSCVPSIRSGIYLKSSGVFVMSKRVKVKLPLIIVLSAFALIAGFSLYSALSVRHASPLWAVDVTDDRKLVGSADNVFVGKVLAKVGNKKLDRLPETQFSVQVEESIKGSLSREVVVNQMGYYGLFNVWSEHQGPRLERGKTYLFVTSYHAGENWHTLVPIYGQLEITSEEERERLVARFTQAFAEQIPYSATGK